VWWLAVTAVGFFAVTGLVIVLGRGSTGPWERHRRAVRTRRRTVVREPPSTGLRARLRRGVAQATAAVPRLVDPIRSPLDRAGTVLQSRGRPLRQALGTLRSRVQALASRPAEPTGAIPEPTPRRHEDEDEGEGLGRVGQRTQIPLPPPRTRKAVRRRRPLRLLRHRRRRDDAGASHPR
jgi:hypothetical protein